MSTQSEITRLQTARDTIRAKAVELGIGISTDKLDALATKLETNLTNQGAVSATVKEGETYTIPKGYHSGNGAISITTEEKTATPTTSAQTITPTTGKVLTKVTVNAIPSNYMDTGGVTVTADKVLTGSKAIGLDDDGAAALIDGAMANNGAVALTMDGLSVTSVTVPAGYHSGAGTVSLTNDIENALAAI